MARTACLPLLLPKPASRQGGALCLQGPHRSRYQYTFSAPGSAPGMEYSEGEVVAPSRAASGYEARAGKRLALLGGETGPRSKASHGVPALPCCRVKRAEPSNTGESGQLEQRARSKWQEMVASAASH